MDKEKRFTLKRSKGYDNLNEILEAPEIELRRGEVFEFLDQELPIYPGWNVESDNESLRDKPKTTPMIGYNAANPVLNLESKNGYDK